MNTELTVKKSDKKLEDYNIETIALENCDILFITKEYNKYNSHLVFKNPFFVFLEEEDNKNINIIEYTKNIDFVRLKNSISWQITDFIIREVALPFIISFLASFISSKTSDNDTIDFSTTIERKDGENIDIQYSGNVKDFKILLEETDFKDLLNNKKD